MLASLGVDRSVDRLRDPVEHGHGPDRRGRRRIPVFIDRHAHDEADVIVPINRVKPHTDFSGPVESGLLKMIAIGLGKQRGADTFHGQGFATFAELIPAVAAFTLSRVNIPFGLALVENGHARLRRDRGGPGRRRCSSASRSSATRPIGYLARLPIAGARRPGHRSDRQGHQRSRDGLRTSSVATTPARRAEPPAIQRIVVRDLTDETEGNAVGIGMADVVLRRAVDRMDRVKTYMNCITAKTPEGARIALTVDTDREALDVAMACCLRVDPPDGPDRPDPRHEAPRVVLRQRRRCCPSSAATGDCEIAGQLRRSRSTRTAGWPTTLPPDRRRRSQRPGRWRLRARGGAPAPGAALPPARRGAIIFIVRRAWSSSPPTR